MLFFCFRVRVLLRKKSAARLTNSIRQVGVFFTDNSQECFGWNWEGSNLFWSFYLLFQAVENSLITDFSPKGIREIRINKQKRKCFLI